jgi:hypothetical protein
MCTRQALVDGKSGIIKMPSWADEVLAPLRGAFA